MTSSQLTSSLNYQIRSGDTLEYDHAAQVGRGGFSLRFSNGAYSPDSSDYAPDGNWHHSSASLNSSVGLILAGATFGIQASTPTTGQWDMWLANILIHSSDGTTHAIYTGGAMSASLWSPCGGNNLTAVGEYVTTGGSTHFQHQDLLGTERLRTNAAGVTESTYSSLPFGDGFAKPGTDDDANHFANLDHDTETDTHHAQFRQYSSTQGRWMSPDPSRRSYKLRNPQSLNRYAYAMNNPLALVDPSGLEAESCADGDGGGSSDEMSCGYDNGGTDGGGGGGGGDGGGGGGCDDADACVTTSDPSGCDYADACVTTSNPPEESTTQDGCDAGCWTPPEQTVTNDPSGAPSNPTQNGCKVVNGRTVCPSPLDDKANKMEQGKNYRDADPMCSLHVVDAADGTEDVHVDEYNPNYSPLGLIFHLLNDAWPDHLYRKNGHYSPLFPAGRDNCR
jgi:RHS repeat-associated protein